LAADSARLDLKTAAGEFSGGRPARRVRRESVTVRGPLYNFEWLGRLALRMASRPSIFSR
jgi:hypothetical protein